MLVLLMDLQSTGCMIKKGCMFKRAEIEVRSPTLKWKLDWCNNHSISGRRLMKTSKHKWKREACIDEKISVSGSRITFANIGLHTLERSSLYIFSDFTLLIVCPFDRLAYPFHELEKNSRKICRI